MSAWSGRLETTPPLHDSLAATTYENDTHPPLGHNRRAAQWCVHDVMTCVLRLARIASTLASILDVNFARGSFHFPALSLPFRVHLWCLARFGRGHGVAHLFVVHPVLHDLWHEATRSVSRFFPWSVARGNKICFFTFFSMVCGTKCKEYISNYRKLATKTVYLQPEQQHEP